MTLNIVIIIFNPHSEEAEEGEFHKSDLTTLNWSVFAIPNHTTQQPPSPHQLLPKLFNQLDYLEPQSYHQTSGTFGRKEADECESGEIFASSV